MSGDDVGVMDSTSDLIAMGGRGRGRGRGGAEAGGNSRGRQSGGEEGRGRGRGRSRGRGGGGGRGRGRGRGGDVSGGIHGAGDDWTIDVEDGCSPWWTSRVTAIREVTNTQVNDSTYIESGVEIEVATRPWGSENMSCKEMTVTLRLDGTYWPEEALADSDSGVDHAGSDEEGDEGHAAMRGDGIGRHMHVPPELSVAAYYVLMERPLIACLVLTEFPSVPEERRRGAEPGSTFRNWLLRNARDVDVSTCAVIVRTKPNPVVDALDYPQLIDTAYNIDCKTRALVDRLEDMRSSSLPEQVAFLSLGACGGAHDAAALADEDSPEASQAVVSVPSFPPAILSAAHAVEDVVTFDARGVPTQLTAVQLSIWHAQFQVWAGTLLRRMEGMGKQLRDEFQEFGGSRQRSAGEDGAEGYAAAAGDGSVFAPKLSVLEQCQIEIQKAHRISDAAEKDAKIAEATAAMGYVNDFALPAIRTAIGRLEGCKGVVFKFATLASRVYNLLYAHVSVWEAARMPSQVPPGGVLLGTTLLTEEDMNEEATLKRTLLMLAKDARLQKKNGQLFIQRQVHTFWRWKPHGINPVCTHVSASGVKCMRYATCGEPYPGKLASRCGLAFMDNMMRRTLCLEHARSVVCKYISVHAAACADARASVGGPPTGSTIDDSAAPLFACLDKGGHATALLSPPTLVDLRYAHETRQDICGSIEDVRAAQLYGTAARQFTAELDAFQRYSGAARDARRAGRLDASGEELRTFVDAVDATGGQETLWIRALSAPCEWVENKNVDSNAWVPMVRASDGAYGVAMGGGGGRDSQPLTIEEWVFLMCDRVNNGPLSRLLLSNVSLAKKAAEYLTNVSDDSLPVLAPDQHLFSFRNGVYAIHKGTFHEYFSDCALPADNRRSSLNFVDGYFNPSWCLLSNPHEIIVPGYDVITTTQYPASLKSTVLENTVPRMVQAAKAALRAKWTYTTDDDACTRLGCTSEQLKAVQQALEDLHMTRWLDRFIGRLFFPLKELDKMEKLLFLKGFPGTGKSSIITAIQQLVGINLGIVDTNTEPQYPLAHVVNSSIWACLEVGRGFQLDTTTLQSMATGESVPIHQKFKLTYTIEWRAPGILAGNVFPAAWLQTTNALGRRFMMFMFDRAPAVDGGDTNVTGLLLKHVGAFLVRTTAAYVQMSYALRLRNVSVEALIPKTLRESTSQFKKHTNPALAFFSGDCSQIEVVPKEVAPYLAKALVAAGIVTYEDLMDVRINKADLDELPACTHPLCQSSDWWVAWSILHDDLAPIFTAFWQSTNQRSKSVPSLSTRETYQVAAIEMKLIVKGTNRLMRWWGVKLASGGDGSSGGGGAAFGGYGGGGAGPKYSSAPHRGHGAGAAGPAAAYSYSQARSDDGARDGARSPPAFRGLYGAQHAPKDTAIASAASAFDAAVGSFAAAGYGHGYGDGGNNA